MGRFLYAKMPEFFGDPARIDINVVLQQFATIIAMFEKKHGLVDVPDGYGNSLSGIFKKYSPSKLHPVWRRLVNEYMPRLAVMLSITHKVRTQGELVLLEPEHWVKAEKLVQWFFSQAEMMLFQIEDKTVAAKVQDKLMRRIAAIIVKYDRGDGITSRHISMNAGSTGTTAEQRRQILIEMEERGLISSSIPGCGRGARFRIKKLPPGFL